MIFDYPSSRSERRHGPQGYSEYNSYRPWLRDEFAFRCIYCLKREKWGQVTAEYELDHFEPQSIRPEEKRSYDNLVYACRRCNNVKRAHAIDDPIEIATDDYLKVMPNGELYGTNTPAERLIRLLDLNAPVLVKWRIRWMRIVELAKTNDPELHLELVSFPDDLPKLNILRPPKGNTRPDGIGESWAALAERGELPGCY